MKAFIRIVLAFLIVPLIWASTMALINHRTELAEQLPVFGRTLAMGDSRVGCGVSDKVLKGSTNIALPAESYLLSWYKLRFIIARQRIDTVILGFGPQNLSDKDHRKFHDNGWATERLIKRMYPLVSVREGLALPMHKKTYARTLFMQYCTWPQETHITYLGHFSGMRKPFHSDSTEAIDRHFLEKDSTVAPVSDFGIACLDSIAALCAREDIALVLVGVPVHATYMRNIPDNYLRCYRELCASYASRGIMVVDRIDPYPGDSLYTNCDHLNYLGARRFTRELRGLLRPAQDSAQVH